MQVTRVIDPKTSTNVDLGRIKVVKRLGGTVEDTELVDGIVFTQKVSHNAGMILMSWNCEKN
jgi:T-complex protein 1 subunit delta